MGDDFDFDPLRARVTKLQDLVSEFLTAFNDGSIINNPSFVSDDIAWFRARARELGIRSKPRDRAKRNKEKESANG